MLIAVYASVYIVVHT